MNILFAIMMVLGATNVSAFSGFAISPSTSKVAFTQKINSNKIAGATSTSLNVFGNKKSKAAQEAEAAKASMYWEGDWVCKDCGYIYNKVSS